jgi:hypothetical protein
MPPPRWATKSQLPANIPDAAQASVLAAIHCPVCWERQRRKAAQPQRRDRLWTAWLIVVAALAAALSVPLTPSHPYWAGLLGVVTCLGGWAVGRQLLDEGPAPR